MKKFSIAYVNPISGKNDNTLAWLQVDLPISITSLNSIEEIFPLLSNPSFNADVIAIDIEQFMKLKDVGIVEVINTLRTLLSCTVYRDGTSIKPCKRQTKLIGVVGHTTDISLIRETEKLMDKIISRPGGSLSYEDMKNDIEDLMSGNMSTSKSIHNLYKVKKKITNASNEIKLTPRQTQILELVSSRGSSNKIIAKILHISESTVKLHMSAILKKYGVKNRTQLALFSKNHQEE
jgi:DNA-binding CsgD family transcriptional regulator